MKIANAELLSDHTFSSLNPTKLSLSRPYDSTQGVGQGFYWFSAAFILFIVAGTLKAFRDDKPWKGRTIHHKPKKEN